MPCALTDECVTFKNIPGLATHAEIELAKDDLLTDHKISWLKKQKDLEKIQEHNRHVTMEEWTRYTGIEP
jgi:hypothetical protein